MPDVSAADVLTEAKYGPDFRRRGRTLSPGAAPTGAVPADGAYLPAIDRACQHKVVGSKPITRSSKQLNQINRLQRT